MNTIQLKRRALIVLFLMAILLFFTIKIKESKIPKYIPRGDYTYVIDYTDKKVERLMKKHDLPSLVIAIIDGEDTVYKQAYGYADLKNQTPATLDTIYKMGSITKLFTGIEIMRLYEEALIDLDQPITTYLEDFHIQTNMPSKAISIRSLLSHRSGLPRGGTLLPWYWEAHPDVLQALTASLNKAYQAFPVGYRYKYSNIGYNVLGRIIEVVKNIEVPAQVSAGGWPYFMKDELLVPLDMQDSSFGTDMLLYGRKPSRDVAMGYYHEEGKNEPYNQYDIIHLASGSLQSTMNDMIKFAKYILLIDKTDQDKIIKGQTLWSMYEPQYYKPTDPQPNGLAWFTDRAMLNELIVFHSGTSQGVISSLMLMPEKKLGVIVFSNSDAFEDLQYSFSTDLMKVLLKTKFGYDFQEKPLEEEVKVEEETLRNYTGKYVINGEIIEVVLKNEKLTASYRGRKVKMIPYTQTKFRLKSRLMAVDDIKLEFFTEEEVMLVTWGDHFVCPRYETFKEIPQLWKDLVGSYDIYARTPSQYSDDTSLGQIEIYIEDHVLFSSGGKVLETRGKNHILIVGGIFAGETMVYDEKTGHITWSYAIYKKNKATN